MQNNKRTISSTVKAIVNEDGTLTITLPLLSDVRKVSHDKSNRDKDDITAYKSLIVAESGAWPQSWATVSLGDGQTAGVNVSVMIDNPDYVPLVPVVPVTTPVNTAAKYFNKKNGANVKTGNGHGKNGIAAIRALARSMPGSVK
jgi:hypothetical protein